MSDMDLVQIEEEITLLCRKRAEVLYQEDISEPYLVFDNERGVIDNNTWVLRPPHDMALLREVEKTLEGELLENFKKWLSDYEENSCKGVCPIIKTPRCCSVCGDRWDCEYSVTRCTAPSEDCGFRGTYKEFER